MSGQRTNTRGRRSKDDRVFPSTIGNVEVDTKTIEEIVSSVGFTPAEEILEEITTQVNLRVAESGAAYLTWRDTKDAAGLLAKGIENVEQAFGQLSSLGANDIGRPLGDHLLGELQYELRRFAPNANIHWQDCVQFLRYLSDNLENSFVYVGGRAAEYHEFIRWMHQHLRIQSEKGGMAKFTKLMEALDDRFPGIVFPPNTVRSSRRDYINNAFRS